MYYKKIFSIRFRVLLWLFLAGGSGCAAQALRQEPDSIFTLPEAKAKLMRSNLALLAAYYDIDIAKAMVIQAKVWNNPYFIFNGDMFNAETNSWFGFRKQYAFQIEQIFSVAGKHTHTVKLARLGVAMAEKQMADVLRSLLYDMTAKYSLLASSQEKESLYRQVLASYSKLLATAKKQLDVGSISGAEAVRLESEYLAVQTQALQNHNQYESALADLRTALRLPEDTVFYVSQYTPIVAADFTSAELIEQALNLRPDLQAQKLNIEYNKRNLKLQQSVAVPDWKLAAVPIDKGSNYTQPYPGLNFEPYLPPFDRNQGRIQAEKAGIMQAGAQYEQLENQVRNEVAAAHNRYKSTIDGLAAYKEDFLRRLEALHGAAGENYQNRNINLLQFIDQQRIYVQTIVQMIDMKQLYIDNVNELNFCVGTNIIE